MLSISNKPTVVLDADGIVYQCDEVILEDINKKHGTSYTIEDIGVYGYTGDEILDKKFHYYNDPKFVLNQPLYPGAKEFVEYLNEHTNLLFCTAVMPSGMSARAEALVRDFNIKREQIIIAADKSLISADYFLDDSPHNIERSIAKHPVLFRRAWNHDVTGVMSITQYDDFICFLNYLERKTPFLGIRKNSIICLVGPSGSGKTNLLKTFESKGFERIKTYTTAPSSEGYNVLTEKEFLDKRDNGFFSETTVYAGMRYGISKETIAQMSENIDNPYVCATDMCGAMSLKNIFKDRVAIVFVEADKKEIYQGILKKNIPDNEKVLRLMSVDTELSNRQFCDVSIRSDFSF